MSLKKFDILIEGHYPSADDREYCDDGEFTEAASTEALYGALKKAKQLCRIAQDWNLDEVEIDDEMVATHELEDEFDEALTRAEQ